MYWTVLCYHPYLVSTLFADLVSLHLVTFLMFFILVHVNVLMHTCVFSCTAHACSFSWLFCVCSFVGESARSSIGNTEIEDHSGLLHGQKRSWRFPHRSTSCNLLWPVKLQVEIIKICQQVVNAFMDHSTATGWKEMVDNLHDYLRSFADSRYVYKVIVK